ncbi:MAG: putative rane protein, partial [Herbinix sp.]|nr:putative rane protein [Herbinix sp.]
LINKVKIKSVNNRNYLDYSYNKYIVESSEQLKTLWEEYVRLKDESRRYKTNTELIEFYNNELIHQLQKFGIKDAEIWIFQTSALLDNKEMVEVRHRLNVRRQKLRERIDINARQKEEALQSIQSTMNAYPDCRDEGEKMLRRYRIEIE